ncbi:MAG TPA: CHAT domain-containing protein [Gaiellaceae bacterium]|nr:CHAT domain-containing protein [Gaiellaceae bacterium]
MQATGIGLSTTVDHTAETLIAAAESAYALVESSPREAAAEARRIMGEAARAREPEAQAAALHALGFAQYQLADAEALRTLRRAIRVAERAGHPTRAAFARRLLAGIYADRGNVRDALREIDRACAGLQGSDLARAQTVRLAVLATLGHSDIDLSFTHVALRRLEREVDQTWQARLLHNRGLVRWNRGDPRAAADFVRSRELFDALGARVTAAAVDLLLVRVALSQDDVVEAIRRLDGIDTTDLPDRLVALVDGHRGRVLLAARLFDEAAEPLRNAEMILVGAGTDGTALEERLEITRLLLAAGEHEDARRGALRIGRSTAIRGNQLLGARATILAIAAAARGGTAGPSDVRVARQAIRVLDKHAPPAERMRARLVLARVALVAGQPSRADAALGEVKSSHVQLPVIDRIDRFAVDAMLYESRGDLTRGRRALRNGLRQLDAHRSTLGSVELRAAASGAGVELSLRGLRMAARSGNAREMLSWAEALRSNSLRLPALKPTRDATLSARQVELRRVTTRIREADARGLPRQRLARRQTELEGEIRARTRAIQGNGGLSTSGSSLRSAQQSLGDRVLVEYVELDGRMHALTLTRAKLRLHELGEAAHGQELDWLRFALRRLARGGLDAPARGAALANAGAAAAALDRQLVEPLREAIGEAPLVLVPTGALHALPWSGLPSLRGRPIVVAPSLETWRELDARTRRRGKHAAFIAGPGLRHATAEIRGLGPLWPDATVLTGKRATVDATLAALDGAALAHFACHGRFRSDSPLFSSLELYDGPLNALDLQRLGRAPDIVVLSACDVALSERHPGDELLGLSAALLASGTRTIIASVVPVPDAAARRLMLDFHRRLVGGASPAAALAATQAGLRADQSALAGFLCLGSG